MAKRDNAEADAAIEAAAAKEPKRDFDVDVIIEERDGRKAKGTVRGAERGRKVTYEPA